MTAIASNLCTGTKDPAGSKEVYGGCGKLLRFVDYLDKRATRQQAVVCPYCDGQHFWPKKRR